MKRQTVVILIVSAVIVTIVGAIAAFFVGRAFVRQIVPKKATEADRRLVVTAARLHEFGGPEPIPEHESITVQRIFGSANIEYRYSPPEGSGIYLQSSTHVTQNVAEAVQTHALSIVGTKTGMLAAEGVALEPTPNLLTFGDQRYAATFKMGGEPRGNVFVLRQGRIVYILVFSGIYFDDPKEVEALFRPVVEEAQKQFVRKR